MKPEVCLYFVRLLGQAAGTIVKGTMDGKLIPTASLYNWQVPDHQVERQSEDQAGALWVGTLAGAP